MPRWGHMPAQAAQAVWPPHLTCNRNKELAICFRNRTDMCNSRWGVRQQFYCLSMESNSQKCESRTPFVKQLATWVDLCAKVVLQAPRLTQVKTNTRPRWVGGWGKKSPSLEPKLATKGWMKTPSPHPLSMLIIELLLTQLRLFHPTILLFKHGKQQSKVWVTHSFCKTVGHMSRPVC